MLRASISPICVFIKSTRSLPLPKFATCLINKLEPDIAPELANLNLAWESGAGIFDVDLNSVLFIVVPPIAPAVAVTVPARVKLPPVNFNLAPVPVPPRKSWPSSRLNRDPAVADTFVDSNNPVLIPLPDIVVVAG